MTIALRFLGAARYTTGSKHLLLVNGQQVLLDCGLVQGPRKIAEEANRKLPLDPQALTAVVLSHAHIDHAGALPMLVKQGYRGTIHCTNATKDLVAVLLRDSANIQMSDAAYLRRKGQDVQPLYDDRDAEATLRLLRGTPYDKTIEVCHGVQATFLDAGHILGSAIVVLDVEDGQRRMRIVFTGDLGRRDVPILRDPERIPECDVLLTESTYGNRLHEKSGDLEQHLCEIVRDELRDGGRLLVPAFAVGRTQRVLYYLGRLVHDGRLPHLPIFVDSPMAREATRVMASHPEVFDDEVQKMLAKGQNPFYFEDVRFVADAAESKTLNGLRSGIIIAASGMCESGRILHHLKQSLPRPEDCVLIVGFMAEGTLGRKLVDGVEHVNVLGDPFHVRCKVRQMPGLSAHADRDEMLRQLRHLAPKTERVFVVHGEDEAALAFASRLAEAGFRRVDVPRKGQEFIVAP